MTTVTIQGLHCFPALQPKAAATFQLIGLGRVVIADLRRRKRAAATEA